MRLASPCRKFFSREVAKCSCVKDMLAPNWHVFTDVRRRIQRGVKEAFSHCYAGMFLCCAQVPPPTLSITEHPSAYHTVRTAEMHTGSCPPRFSDSWPRYTIFPAWSSDQEHLLGWVLYISFLIFPKRNEGLSQMSFLSLSPITRNRSPKPCEPSCLEWQHFIMT